MWFIWWDPCGLLCVAIGQVVVWFADYVTVRYVFHNFFNWSPVGIAHFVLFQTIIFLIVASHFRAMLSDPGTVKMHTASEADRHPPADDPDRLRKPKRRYCRRCECIKPPRAHHCSTCDRCIYKMDHHCPWVGNCVAANNFKYFLQFLFFVFVGCMYAAGLMTYRLVFCVMKNSKNPEPGPCQLPPTLELVLCIVSTVCAVFFAIFVVAMGCDQYEGMTTDTTGIESMKQWDEEDRTLCEGISDYCGEPLSINWFIPKPMPKESQYHWSENDDPDAYDPRDPLVQRFFYELQRKEQLAQLHNDEQAAGLNVLHPPRPPVSHHDDDIISDDDDDGDGAVDLQCHPAGSTRGSGSVVSHDVPGATAEKGGEGEERSSGKRGGGEGNDDGGDQAVPTAGGSGGGGGGSGKKRKARKRNVARS